ncbi:SDR family NAD(P)-dependent oxidoreductase [Mucilaginibacter sp.]|uniref:SDR family NAD(P)-dependent oxidoreductase n=1 Tax=Mucilaginibacter sp. TaxID=1882438 RepID=UPI003AFFD46C
MAIYKKQNWRHKINMVNQLKEKKFLITGGSSGVGKATAIGLAQKGAKIIIVSRDAEASTKTLQEIAQRTGNDKGEYLIADLSLQSSVKKLAEEFKRKIRQPARFGKLCGNNFW